MKMARAGALAGALLIVAACTGGASTAPTVTPAPATPAGSAEPTEVPGPGTPEKATLKIVQGSSPDYTQIALTKAIQILNDKGIATEFANVDDTDTATRSVIAGQSDIVVNSLYFGINARKAEIPLVTIMADAQTLDYLLVSIPSITSVEQLVGGTVGINKPGDLGATVADQCLKFSKIDVTTVEFVQVGGTGARMAALISGQIMAAPAHAAEALNAQIEGGLNILVDCGKAIGSFLQTGATSTEEWLAANPNLAQHFVDAYIDALRWAEDNKDEYIALSKEVLPEMSDSLRSPAYDVFKEAGLFAINGGLTPESIAKLVAIGLDASSIEEPIPDTWYTMKYIESYLARNGER